MAVAHLISQIPVKSFGTMPIRLDWIHSFGKCMLEEVTKRVRHMYASNNYPMDSAAGSFMIDLINDLTMIFLMYSPRHASENRT